MPTRLAVVVGPAVMVAGALLLAAPSFAQPAEPQPWIHIEVTGDGDDVEHVNINLPLSLAEAALALAPPGVVTNGQLDLDGREVPVNVMALRGVWQSLMAVGDSEFVTVRHEDQTIRVARAGDVIEVRVTEADDGATDTVDAQLPVVVVDALLSGDSDKLNVRAAIERLSTLRGDIVRVTEADRQIRVWIDEVAGG